MKNIKIVITKFPAGKIVFGLNFGCNKKYIALAINLFKWGVLIGYFK